MLVDHVVYIVAACAVRIVCNGRKTGFGSFHKRIRLRLLDLCGDHGFVYSVGRLFKVHRPVCLGYGSAQDFHAVGKRFGHFGNVLDLRGHLKIEQHLIDYRLLLYHNAYRVFSKIVLACNAVGFGDSRRFDILFAAVFQIVELFLYRRNSLIYEHLLLNTFFSAYHSTPPRCAAIIAALSLSSNSGSAYLPDPFRVNSSLEVKSIRAALMPSKSDDIAFASPV